MFARSVAILYLVLFATVAFAQSPTLSNEEVYRIRIRNKAGGLVQVSVDGGKSYGTVGRVTVAANARIVGFAAASYIPQGTIAATAVHGLRIKTGQFALGLGKAQMPLMFSVCPLEFAGIPKGYGGHQPRSSGIHTDIYTGYSIFRNLSPYVGSQVYVERNHNLLPLPLDYTPVVGDTFVIIVRRPVTAPSEVDFDNKLQGNVTAKYPDGREEVIAYVYRPVSGIGRYDGTTFTGVGAINTNHGGVITISTAPVCAPKTKEGGSIETRGGFMIQPYYHVHEQGESAVQVMVVGPKDKSKPIMEGTPPLFDGCINLSYFKESPESSYHVQVKIDDGDWEDVPEIVGRVDNGLTAEYLNKHFSKIGKPRQITKGVTAVRLLFGKPDIKLIAEDFNREVSDYTARAVKSNMGTVKGTIGLSPRKPSNGRCVVNFYVDGNPIYVSNEYPYRFKWDTAKVSNGLHVIEIETNFNSSSVVESREVLVKN